MKTCSKYTLWNNDWLENSKSFYFYNLFSKFSLLGNGSIWLNIQIGEKPFLGSSHESLRGPGMEDGKGADCSYEFLGTTFMNNQIGEKPFLGSSYKSSRRPGMEDGKGCAKNLIKVVKNFIWIFPIWKLTFLFGSRS